MPLKIEVQVTKDEIRPMLVNLRNRLGNLLPVMKNVGELLARSIHKNFEQEGRPAKWVPLAKSTIKQREAQGHWPGKILMRHGFLSQVIYKEFPDKVILSNRPEAKAYAAIHHFGGMAGRGKKVKIPARPYMMIQDEDWDEIKTLAGEYLVKTGG